jgi:ATP-binding cassette subfamily G (WHITE) protein 2 (SNQ2)
MAYFRSPNYGYTRVLNHILVGLWQGLFFLNIGNSRTDLQYRIFAVRPRLPFLSAFLSDEP